MQAVETISFILNDKNCTESLPPGMVVLDYLRQHQRLTGTKEGCREGDCGACFILLGRLQNGRILYRSVNSCLLPIGDISSSHLVTIEGLNGDGLNPIQKIFVDESASQCGFCTPGFIIALIGFFLATNKLTESAAIAAMDGNICRCTGYTPIKRAAKILAQHFGATLPPAQSDGRLQILIEQGVLPSYFSAIAAKLHKLTKNISTTHSAKGGRIVAGGTDLFVQRADELKTTPLNFLSHKAELSHIWSESDKVYLGASVTVEQMHASPILSDLFARLDTFIKLISSTPIRNRATIGGNIVNASPIGDLSIFFLALDASLRLTNGKQHRSIFLKDFFLDYKKLDLAENEIIEWIEFPKPTKPFYFNFEKVSKRIHLDIASVNSAMRIEMDGDVIRDIALSAGGVAPIPLYLQRTVDALKGASLSPTTIKEAAATALEEISPISDVRGSGDYKKLLLRQLIYSHFVTLFPEQLTPEALL
jgi:xanthine dehydrogenase small subunit